MAEAPDNILNILVQLGVIGEKDVAAAKDLLSETGQVAGKDMATSLPEGSEAWAKYKFALGGASEGAEGFNLHGKEMHKVVNNLNHVIPGLGGAVKELKAAFSGGGPMALLLLSLEAAITYWDLYKEKAAEAAEATAKALEKIRTATATARTELEDFNKAMEKARNPDDAEAAEIANQRAINAAQFKYKRDMLALDEATATDKATTPEQKEAVKKDFASRRNALESAAESTDLNVVNTVLEKLRQDLAGKDEKRRDLEDEKLTWAQTIEKNRRNGDSTDFATGELNKVVDQIKKLNEEIVAAQTKITKYSGEAGTAQSVHGINDAGRLDSENRVVSKAVREGFDPALAGAQLSDDQRMANAALTQLFGQYKNGTSVMMAIINNHLAHSTSQAQEINALKTALETLRAQNRNFTRPQ